LVIPIAVASHPAIGAQWTMNSGIAPKVSYTDNVCLEAENEQSEAIALVNTDLQIRAVGKRARFDIGASVEVNSLSESKLEDLGCTPSGFGNRDQVVPRLSATANAELFEDWLFVDLAANVDQNEVNPSLPGGGDRLNRKGNTNTYARYSLSPYISHRFADVATFQLRYTTDDETNSEDTAIAGSSEDRVILNLDSNDSGTPLSWGLQGSYSDIEYEETDSQPAGNSELSSGQVDLGYQLNRYWQINGYYGIEDNDFVSSSDDIDGDFWDVGIRWTPNSRTTVDLGFGDRFFGTTPRTTISHEYRRSTFSASYSRDLTYDRNIRSVGRDPFFNNNQLRPLDPLTGLPLDIGGNQSSVSTSPIIDERFTLGYTYKFRRGALRIDASHSEQTRTEDEGDQSFQSYSLSFDRSLTRSLSFNAALRFSKNDAIRGRDSFGITDNELVTFDIGLSRPINSNVDVRFDYQYTTRRADVSSNEYDENRMTLTLQLRL